MNQRAHGTDHRPVLVEETVSLLVTDPDGIYVDGTFGRGGHAAAVLERLSAGGRLIAMDRDPEAVAAARALAVRDPRLEALHASFASLGEVVAERGLSGRVSGVVLDLGVSSPQLDDPARGFSFMQDGPLDMRMDPTCGEPVSSWLNRASAREIAGVLRRFGEERHAARIARAVEQRRGEARLERTGELAALVAEAVPRRAGERGAVHPATRTFQALRILVNRELQSLETVLPLTLDALAIGGRLAIISFHSLEDRMVKRFVRSSARPPDAALDLPVANAEATGPLRPIGRARRPSPSEVAANPRARSARLRVAERVRSSGGAS